MAAVIAGADRFVKPTCAEMPSFPLFAFPGEIR